MDAAPGTTLAETNDILTEMQNSIKDIEEIQTYNQVAGFSFSGSGASHAMMMIRLKDWSLRPDKDQSYTDKDQSYTAVIEKIYANTAHIKNAQIFIFAPPMISGYGTGNSFFVDLQDRSGRGIDALEEVTQGFIAALNERPEVQMAIDALEEVTQGFIAALNERPEVQMAYTSFSSDFPQYQIDVDAAKCIRAGTTTDAVLSVLSGYYGSMYVSNFNRFTKLYRVILQAVSPSSIVSSCRLRPSSGTICSRSMTCMCARLTVWLP